MNNFSAELETAASSARRAGAVIMDHYGRLGDTDVREKAENDMVTVVDTESQKIIVTALREHFPDDYIVAEENLPEDVNAGRDPHGSRRWIVDPLDGTTNYVHGYPAFAVSIALEVDGILTVGLTYAPRTNELFHAVDGQGAFLDGKPIHVSSVDESHLIFLGTGFPFRARHFLDIYLKSFAHFFGHARGIRRAGSAALDFAWVASGRLDGFWEMTLSPWDIAAGVVLVQEAGGRVSDFFGGDSFLNEGHVVATNGYFHEWMVTELSEVFPRDLDFTRRS